MKKFYTIDDYFYKNLKNLCGQYGISYAAAFNQINRKGYYEDANQRIDSRSFQDEPSARRDFELIFIELLKLNKFSALEYVAATGICTFTFGGDAYKIVVYETHTKLMKGKELILRSTSEDVLAHLKII